ncbi:MAG: PocR ligand-binding domain-containing protein [Oscillospiraceae bacterium]
MIKICDNLIDISSLEISDIVDMQKLISFQEVFAEKTGCALTVVDREGKSITPTSRFCKYCEYYVRNSAEGIEKCSQSHQHFVSEAMRYSRVHISKCHAYVTEFAFPVVIENQIIGGVVGGHYTIDKIRPAEVRDVCERYEINPENLLNASTEIERKSKKDIEVLATTVRTAVEAMVNEGYIKAQTKIIAESFSKSIKQIEEGIDEMSKTADGIGANQRELSKNIENIGEASEKIDDVLDSITRLADQTKILSFNAQIEAVRAGAVGKSFTVVAGEIKDLADSSKSTAENISALTTAIKADVESTVASSEKTIDSADAQAELIDDAKDNIEELALLAKRFSKFISKK